MSAVNFGRRYRVEIKVKIGVERETTENNKKNLLQKKKIREKSKKHDQDRRKIRS